MLIERLSLPGILLVTAKKWGDARGFFSETFRLDLFEREVGGLGFVQDNHARSARKGVVRGLHFQIPPYAQGKLVRCSRGAILDVAVDIRQGSPSYGRHVAVELSGDNWQQLWVPPGFAHGYSTLTDDCEVMYKVTNYYSSDHDRGIAWDDPALGIDWRVTSGEAQLSDKDIKHPRLADISPSFTFEAVGAG